MFRYVAWADRRTLEAVRAVPACHVEALPLLAHMLAAEHVWLSRLEGVEPRHAVWPELGLESCQTLQAENEAGYAALLGRLDEAELGRRLRYRTSGGLAFETPVLDILMQIITHGPYHRGQIAKAIARHPAGRPSQPTSSSSPARSANERMHGAHQRRRRSRASAPRPSRPKAAGSGTAMVKYWSPAKLFRSICESVPVKVPLPSPPRLPCGAP